jgi:hypothetical protein
VKNEMNLSMGDAMTEVRLRMLLFSHCTYCIFQLTINFPPLFVQLSLLHDGGR